jgi:hypothetical protein
MAGGSVRLRSCLSRSLSKVVKIAAIALLCWLRFLTIKHRYAIRLSPSKVDDETLSTVLSVVLILSSFRAADTNERIGDLCGSNASEIQRKGSLVAGYSDINSRPLAFSMLTR